MSSPSNPAGRRQTAAILLAAGSSRRMGGGPDGDKLWADLGGEPLIAHSLRALAAVEAVTVVVAVAPAERHEALRALASALSIDLRLTEGGQRRRDSVAAGLAAAADAQWYLVHDGARPLLTTALAERVLAAAREHGAAIPALAVPDTIKRVDGAGRIVETVAREGRDGALRSVQTPQAFAGDLLRRAHAASDGDATSIEATDDAMLVERLGAPVWTVEGDPANVKVTVAADLALVRALLAARDGAASAASGDEGGG